MDRRAIVLFLILPVCLLMTALTTGDAQGGAFANKKLLVDVKVDEGVAGGAKVNHGVTNLPPTPKGQTITFELFVEGGGGHETTGYRIVFKNQETGPNARSNVFSDYFSIQGMEGVIRQFGTPSLTSVEAKNVFPFIVPTNGYIATITLTTKLDIVAGMSIEFESGTSGTSITDGETSVRDALNVNNAAVSFGATGFSVSLDTDANTGDQRIKAKYGVEPGDEISIEIYGGGVHYSVGYILRFEYDPNQVTFGSFSAGTLLPNVQALEPVQGVTVLQDETTLAYVEVAAAALGGTASSDTGLFGTITFTAGQSFSGTSIQMVNPEIRRGGQFIALTSVTEVTLQKASFDFDGDGVTGFRDFLLFAEKFGSQRGDGRYHRRFDMDGDGVIGQLDFDLFQQNLGVAP